jgi:hypothetical protein
VLFARAGPPIFIGWIKPSILQGNLAPCLLQPHPQSLSQLPLMK